MRRNNKIFFSLKKDLIINIIIAVQLIIAIFYIYKFMSITLFKDEYTKLYKNSYPMEAGKIIQFTEANKVGETINIADILEKAKQNDVEIGVNLENCQSEYYLSASQLGIMPNELISKYEYAPMPISDTIIPIKMNFAHINNNKDKLVGDLEEEKWKIEDNKVPVIAGKTLAKKFKIGDTFKNNENKIFEVMGYFDEYLLYAGSYDTVIDGKEISSRIIIPMEEKDKEIYANEPLNIYNWNNEKMEKVLKDYEGKYSIEGYNEGYDWFMAEIKYDLYKKTIRAGIMTFAAITALMITLLIKLIICKDRFGILYSLGMTKKEITQIYVSEFSYLIYIVLIGSFLLVKKFGRFSFRYFWVAKLEWYWILSTIIILILIGFCLKYIFKQIGKMSPREMMEGFTK